MAVNQDDEFENRDDEPLYDFSIFEDFIEPASGPQSDTFDVNGEPVASPYYDAFHTVDTGTGDDNGVSFVDADEQEVANGDDHFEATNIYIGNENGAGDVKCKTRSQKRVTIQKPKKDKVEAVKTARKSKKSKEIRDGLAPKPPKRFLHSTRRKRRRVDKVLLDTPEEELDHANLPFKDLILLAEHKERLFGKEAATKRSATDVMVNGNRDEDGINSAEGRASIDEEENIDIRHDGSYFNYHTYMDKTPVARWTKCETELFYEAVRQFGSDISMIQQLFPRRSRRQVKLKYKKEERQHPLRLDDALHSRSKDHSRFEEVIERLRKSAALQEATSIDDAVDEVCEEIETPVDGTKENEDVHLKDEEAGLAEAPAAEAHDSDEEDMLRWSEYTSYI